MALNKCFTNSVKGCGGGGGIKKLCKLILVEKIVKHDNLHERRSGHWRGMFKIS